METMLVMLIGTIVSAIVTYYSNQQTTQSQQDMLDQQQQFNADQAEITRQWSSEPERYNRMTTQLGFNPDLAAQAVMGVQGAQGYSAQSPSAPALPNLAGSLGNILGGLPSDLLSSIKQPAEISNIESQTNKNNMESFYIPLTAEAQVEYWKGFADEARSKIPMNEKLARLYEKQGDWVEPISQAQCLEYRSQYMKNMEDAVLAYQKSITEGSLRDMYQAYEAEAYSQASLNGQMKEESEAKERYFDNLANSEYYKSLQEFYNSEIRQKLNGLPLSDDMKFNLFVMKAVGDVEMQQMSDDIFNQMLLDMRSLKDNETQSNWENFGKNWLMNMGNVVPDMVGNMPFMFRIPLGGYRPAGSSRSSAKPSSSSSRTANGNKGGIRYDSYGNVLPNYNFSNSHFPN